MAVTNNLTIVLVIWPNRDYHFYRLVTGGPYWWWGHKPGGTPAKYTDDCGHSIYQFQGSGYAPNNICRGPYGLLRVLLPEQPDCVRGVASCDASPGRSGLPRAFSQCYSCRAAVLWPLSRRLPER